MHTLTPSEPGLSSKSQSKQHGPSLLCLNWHHQISHRLKPVSLAKTCRSLCGSPFVPSALCGKRAPWRPRPGVEFGLQCHQQRCVTEKRTRFASDAHPRPSWSVLFVRHPKYLHKTYLGYIWIYDYKYTWDI